MGELAPDKIVVILIVAFLLFGARRLPEVGASLGKGIREFKRSLSDSHESGPPVQDGPSGSAEAPPQSLPSAPPATSWQPKRLSD